MGQKRDGREMAWFSWDKLCEPKALGAGAELHVRVGPPKIFEIFFYHIEIFNILIISPQKWDSPPNYLSWSNNILKKICPICLVVMENVLFLKFIFMVKCVLRFFKVLGHLRL